MWIKLQNRWWIAVPLALVLGLAGCDSPSPAFGRLTARQVTVDGSTFSVRATAYDAEAIRVNREWMASRGAVVVKGALAIQIATGCTVRKRSLSGDTNIVRAKLDCPGAVPPLEGTVQPRLNCELASDWRMDGFGDETAEVTCDLAR